MRNSVVLPAPFGPITPTMPPRGRRNVRSSNSRLSPYALRQLVRSIDDIVAEPRAGRDARSPARCELSLDRPRLSSSSYALMRALPFAWRACGDMRIHSSSRSSVFCRADSCFSSCASRCLLLLEPRRVVALPRDAFAAIELEDPLRDVVQEVAIVRDRDDGARDTPADAARATRRDLGIEMVGRLVEQQHVRLLEQQPAQRDAALLAAGERRRRRRRRGGQRSASIAMSSLRSRSHASGGVDLVLHARPARPAACPSRRRASAPRTSSLISSNSCSRSRDRLHALLDVAAHVVRRDRAAAPAARKPTRVPRRGHASPRKSLSTPAMMRSSDALAGAVGAEHADLRARIERQPDALQNLPLGRDDLAEILHHVNELRGTHGSVSASR